MSMTFGRLMSAWRWVAIPDCPGRFVLKDPNAPRHPADLLGPCIDYVEHRSEQASDTIVVAWMDDGGLISYRKKNGGYVHTLNTPEGFARKLAHLGIAA
ncbi:MAG: hypothetical protein V4673_08050 [Pseudomonadota bacterium]